MYSHHSKQQQQSNLSRSLPPTPTQLHHPDFLQDEDDGPDDDLADSDDVPLPFPIKTIVADPQTNLSLTLVSALGAGSYAVVYLAKEVASGSLYALKCLGKDKLTDEELAIQRNEVSQLSQATKFTRCQPQCGHASHTHTLPLPSFLPFRLCRASTLRVG